MGVFAGAVLFGWTDALRIRQSDSVHATLLAVVAIAVIVALIKLYQKKFKVAIISLVCGSLVLFYFFAQKVVPDEFVTFFPNLTTIIVLAFLSQRLRPPAMAGAPYRKGEE
jgi:simple sugar transport system permease protein